MKILVCGASGFMGTNLYEYFSKYDVTHPTANYSYPTKYATYNVSGLTKKSYSVFHFKCDLLKPKKIKKLLDKIKPDIIIQAAATTSGSVDIVNSPWLHVTDNAVMNSYLLRAAQESNVRHFIFLSCGVLYEQNTGKPVKEEDLNYNLHPTYFGVGWTKIYIEKMCEFYSKLGNTKFTVIRHSNTYGPHDKYNSDKSHVFAALITKVMNAQDGDTIEVWGNGSEERDLVHVNDVCKFIDLIIEKQTSNFEIYNIGAGYSISIKDLAEKIIKLSGKSLKINYNTSKPTIPTVLTLDCSKAKAIGWEPYYDLDKGILDTILYYKNYCNYIK